MTSLKPNADEVMWTVALFKYLEIIDQYNIIKIRNDLFLNLAKHHENIPI